MNIVIGVIVSIFILWALWSCTIVTSGIERNHVFAIHGFTCKHKKAGE